MSEWQDIETAPKDETELLLFCPGMDAPYWMSLSDDRARYPANSGIVVGRYYDRQWVSHAGEPSWDDSITATRITPTHWMPLPGPPTPNMSETE
jgi:hypothetical protein